MASIPLILATLVDPLVPIAGFLSLGFMLASMNALAQKRHSAALFWFMAFCGCVLFCIGSLRPA